MIATRKVGAERLDELPPQDPGARGSRRDLGRINSLTRHPALLAELIGSRPIARLLDLGAGDGALLLKVARRVPKAGPVHAVLLDQHDLLPEASRAAFARMGWRAEPVVADAFEYLAREQEPFDVVLTNHFLHHWPDPRLAELLALISARARMLVACEPFRARSALAGSRLLWAIGCNGVTRYDARVSILAGFRKTELSALWPGQAGWSFTERDVPPFSHVFRAERAS